MLKSRCSGYGAGMDALIDLSLRALFWALLHPLSRTILLTLAALYGMGSDWPPLVSGALWALALASALHGAAVAALTWGRSRRDARTRR